MSPGPRPEHDESALRAALAAVGERGQRSGRSLVVCSRSALWLRGMSCHLEGIEVVADGPPSGHVDAQDVPGGGWTWLEGAVAVRWIQRTDHYAPLYRAAADGAESVPGSPLPAAPIPLVAAMLLASRGPEDAALITALIVGGQLDAEVAREVIEGWLGVYAMDDLEALIQEAEWQVMRQRYNRGDKPH